MGSGGPGANGDDLRAHIDALVRQLAAQQWAIDALEKRVDASEARAEEIEARALDDREMIAELQREGVLSRAQVEQLEEALKASRTIGAAIGILMESRQVSEEAAFDLLKDASSRSNRKLRELASELVASVGRSPS